MKSDFNFSMPLLSPRKPASLLPRSLKQIKYLGFDVGNFPLPVAQLLRKDRSISFLLRQIKLKTHRRSRSVKHQELRYESIQEYRYQSWGSWGSRPPGFGLRGSWTGVGKYFSLFSAERMLESGLFLRKREKLARNIGVNGKNWHLFGRNKTFLSWWLEKGHQNFLPRKSEFFLDEI